MGVWRGGGGGGGMGVCLGGGGGKKGDLTTVDPAGEIGTFFIQVVV